MKRQEKLQAFAKNMRSTNYTDAERKMWLQLRNRQLQYKFNRQYVFDNRYILDFFCAEKKLVIEIDGGQHNDNPADKTRDDYLRHRGYTILRFWDNDVLVSLEGCLLTIKNALDRL